MENQSKPGATKQDLENYLTLLTDDIGHQHLPYDQDDTRKVGGKHGMRKGMSYYLGLHSKYSAKLISYTTGFNIIIIQYETHSEGVHPQSGQIITQNYNTVEALEIENNNVSVIRKYSEFDAVFSNAALHRMTNEEYKQKLQNNGLTTNLNQK